MAKNVRLLLDVVMADPARAARVAEHEAALRESLAQADADLAAGRTRPAADVFAELDTDAGP